MEKPSDRPYLTIAETAELARVSPARIRNLMVAGTLKEGVHFTRPAGLHPRFLRTAVLAWLEPKAARRIEAAPTRPRTGVNPAVWDEARRRAAS